MLVLVLVYILILTITELLFDNASVPAGGPFTVLAPVDNASVTACGPIILCSTACDTSSVKVDITDTMENATRVTM